MSNGCLAARFLRAEITSEWTRVNIQFRLPKAELWPDRHDPELQLCPRAPVRSTESQKTVAHQRLRCKQPSPAFLRTVAARCETRGPYLPCTASYEVAIGTIGGPPMAR